MGDLLPGEALIYERANGVTFARYRDKPEIPRWIVGGDPVAVAKAEGKMLGYGEWEDLHRVAENNPTLKKLLTKTVNTYYMVKDEYKED